MWGTLLCHFSEFGWVQTDSTGIHRLGIHEWCQAPKGPKVIKQNSKVLILSSHMSTILNQDTFFDLHWRTHEYSVSVLTECCFLLSPKAFLVKGDYRHAYFVLVQPLTLTVKCRLASCLFFLYCLNILDFQCTVHWCCFLRQAGSLNMKGSSPLR